MGSIEPNGGLASVVQQRRVRAAGPTSLKINKLGLPAPIASRIKLKLHPRAQAAKGKLAIPLLAVRMRPGYHPTTRVRARDTGLTSHGQPALVTVPGFLAVPFPIARKAGGYFVNPVVVRTVPGVRIGKFFRRVRRARREQGNG